MIRTCLSLSLVLGVWGSALAQGDTDGLPLPTRPAPAAAAAASQQVLSGVLDYVTDKNPFKLGQYWLVTDDGSRIRMLESETLKQLSHGWLRDRRIEARAEVTPEGARLVEGLDPRPLELRATVVEEAGAIVLETAEGRLTVVDENPRYDFGTGPDLAKHLIGKTVKAQVFAFPDGTAWLWGVEARARKVHWQPIVLPPALLIPWWKPAGEVYWVRHWSEERGPSIGRAHDLDEDELDFEAAPQPAQAAGMTATLRRAGD